MKQNELTSDLEIKKAPEDLTNKDLEKISGERGILVSTIFTLI